MGVIAPRKGTKTSSAFLASNPASWRTSFSGKKMNGFDQNCSAELGQGTGVRTQQHCAFSRTPIVFTNASMDLGLDWFGCLKRFSRSIIINYCTTCFRFFFRIWFIFSKGLPEIWLQQTMTSIGWDSFENDVHFAHCLYEGWFVKQIWHYVFIQKYPKLKQPFGMGRVWIEK